MFVQEIYIITLLGLKPLQKGFRATSSLEHWVKKKDVAFSGFIQRHKKSPKCMDYIRGIQLQTLLYNLAITVSQMNWLMMKLVVMPGS